MDESISPAWTRRAKQRMKVLSVTCRALADRAGYKTHTATSKHLNRPLEQLPSWEVLCAYATALRCTPEWLARAEGNPPEEAAAPVEVYRQYGSGRPQAPTSIGQRVRWARAHRDLRQSELAARVVVDGRPVCRQSINKLELDQIADPGSKIMLAIARATCVSVEWLIEGRGSAARVEKASDAPPCADVVRRALEATETIEKAPGTPPFSITTKAQLVTDFIGHFAGAK